MYKSQRDKNPTFEPMPPMEGDEAMNLHMESLLAFNDDEIEGIDTLNINWNTYHYPTIKKWADDHPEQPLPPEVVEPIDFGV